MATSSMAIAAEDIIDLANDTANDSDDVDANVSAITTHFNAMLETATGHDHDGTNSKSIGSGFAGLSVSEFTVAIMMGIFE